MSPEEEEDCTPIIMDDGKRITEFVHHLVLTLKVDQVLTEEKTSDPRSRPLGDNQSAHDSGDGESSYDTCSEYSYEEFLASQCVFSEQNQVTSAGSEDDQLDSWNPMEAEYFSVQNLLQTDIDNSPGEFALGIKEKKLSWNETPCPSYKKGDGKFCWKGQSCRMLHKVEEATDLGKEKELILTTATLDRKPVLFEGMTIDVVVKHMVSPSDFYVVPVSSPDCICEAGLLPRKMKDAKNNPMEDCHSNRGDINKISEDTMIEEFGTGYDAFNKIGTTLRDVLETNMNWRLRQQPHYTETQLVAVQVAQNGHRNWFRGFIVESDLQRTVERRIPFHLVQLLDVGEMLTVRADSLCRLPLCVSYYPALAFKCCLNAVVPVRNIWTRKAVTTFEKLTAGQVLKMTIMKMNDSAGEGRPLETNPYQVDLMLHSPIIYPNLTSSSTSPYASLSDVLASSGLGIFLSHFPKRPALNAICRNELLLSPINDKYLSERMLNMERNQLLNIASIFAKTTKPNVPRHNQRSFSF